MVVHGPAEAAADMTRLERLRSYDVLDTPDEAGFDDVAELAARVCGTPIALVSLVDQDRQWFKARVGLDVCQTPRSSSFCAQAMLGDTIMEIPDTALDPRFAGNPLVVGDPHIRFYAGAPLVSPDGHPLGSLCVIDRRPRRLTGDQRRGLLTLARHVMAELELREYIRDTEAANRRLRSAEEVKDEFLARVSHELRTPLTSINGYLEILDDGDVPRETSGQFVATIRRNSDRLLALVDDMLLAAQLTSSRVVLNRRQADVAAVAHTVVAEHTGLAAVKGLTLQIDAPAAVVTSVDDTRLAQALERLVFNAIKFTARGGVLVTVRADGDEVCIDVADTGIGIRADDHDRLFAPFRRTSIAETQEVQGAGLGLTIVKAIVDAHGGRIDVHSVERGGTSVRITLPARSPAA